MKTLGGILGFVLLFFVGQLLLALGGLPDWAGRGLAWAVLLLLLAGLDSRTGGHLTRLVTWVAYAAWGRLQAFAARRGQQLPGLPARPARPARPVAAPLATPYQYVVPDTAGQVVTVAPLPPSAVYTYFVPGVMPPEYIGKADDPDRRHQEHARDGRPWTRPGVERDVQWYPSEQVALAVERAAIMTLGPVYNVQHNGSRQVG